MNREAFEILTEEELLGLDNAKRKEERLRRAGYLKLRSDGESKLRAVLHYRLRTC